jgi:hypothetical protein
VAEAARARFLARYERSFSVSSYQWYFFRYSDLKVPLGVSGSGMLKDGAARCGRLIDSNVIAIK